MIANILFQGVPRVGFFRFIIKGPNFSELSFRTIVAFGFHFSRTFWINSFLSDSFLVRFTSEFLFSFSNSSFPLSNCNFTELKFSDRFLKNSLKSSMRIVIYTHKWNESFNFLRTFSRNNKSIVSLKFLIFVACSVYCSKYATLVSYNWTKSYTN